MRDDEAMDRALLAAASARRQTAPWPWVGCVIVRDGVVVGEGATGPFREGDHAEAAALRAAGDRAQGATAYVTLEPCDHQGNTPPCSRSLIDAGVARVVVAIGDPDPIVSGRGFERLRSAGVDVVVGVQAEAATQLLAPYLHHRRTGRPFVTAKIATTLDGRVAAADGSSRWITADAARADAHELRADAQAIVIGSGTALADHPALTVRDVEVAPRHAPRRVLLDARGRVAAEGPLFDTVLAPTLVVTTAAAPPGRVDEWTAAGAKVEIVDPAAAGGVDLDQVFALLGREGVLHALVEGGGTLLGAVLDAGQAQRLVAYVAPLVLGERAVPGYRGAGPDTLAAAARFALAGVRQLGPDVRLDYELEH